MKLLIISLLISTSAFANTYDSLNFSCSQQEVELAQKMLDIKNVAFENGFATRAQVLDKEVLLLDTQACASVISKEDYCAEKSKKLRQLTDINDLLYQHGMVTLSALNESQAIERSHNQLCSML